MLDNWYTLTISQEGQKQESFFVVFFFPPPSTFLYLDYLIRLSDAASSPSKKLAYIDRADTVLEYFSENALLNEGVVSSIKEYKERLEERRSAVAEEIAAKERDAALSGEKYNADALSLIERLADNILSVTDEESLNRIVDNVKRVDKSIETEFLTDEQAIEYERLTAKCQDAVTKKLSALEEERNRDYNLRAIEAFDKALRLIKNAETIETTEKIIIDFLSFDASRLTTETMIYYNHVYSFIFSKLSDEERFAFTKKAIILQKRSKL